MSTEEKIVSILEDFENSARDVIATGVVKKDGFSIADTAKKNMDTKVYAAMTAGLFGLSTRVMNSIKGGDLIQTYVKGEKTELLIMSVPDRRVFVVAITKKNPNIGLIIYELERTVEKLLEVL